MLSRRGIFTGSLKCIDGSAFLFLTELPVKKGILTLLVLNAKIWLDLFSFHVYLADTK